MYGLHSGKIDVWTVPDSKYHEQMISIRLTEHEVSIWIKDVEFPASLLEINPTKVRFTFRMIKECEYECSAVRTGSKLEGKFEAYGLRFSRDDRISNNGVFIDFEIPKAANSLSHSIHIVAESPGRDLSPRV
jgi:hypothetical protein